MRRQVKIVTGLTGTGKTSSAIKLAKKQNGELISADSRQIYKFMSIGTNVGRIEKATDSHAYRQAGRQQKIEEVGSMRNDEVSKEMGREEEPNVQSLRTTNKVLNLSQNIDPNYPLLGEGRVRGIKNDNFWNSASDYPSTITNQPSFIISGIPIHLIQFLDPDQRFSVFQFKELAEFWIEDILSRGKLPIIVGGTGLYIQSLMENFQLKINNEQLKKKKSTADSLSFREISTKSRDDEKSYLQSKDNSSKTEVISREYLEKLSVNELQNLLKTHNSELITSMNESDRKNPRRLVRAIEKVVNNEVDSYVKSEPKYDFDVIQTEYNWEELKKNLDLRVEKMFEDGLVEETKNILKLGFSEDSVALQGIGYREVLSYLKNVINLQECIEKVKISHRRYAKKQQTWFKKQFSIKNNQLKKREYED